MYSIIVAIGGGEVSNKGNSVGASKWSFKEMGEIRHQKRWALWSQKSRVGSVSICWGGQIIRHRPNTRERRDVSVRYTTVCTQAAEEGNEATARMIVKGEGRKKKKRKV